MGLSDAPLLFAFEHASSENFTYIPMIVRFNLDRFGLRISLEQWQLLPLEDRKLLARFPADEDTAIGSNFDHALFEMLRTHADRPRGSSRTSSRPGVPPTSCRSRSCSRARWPG